MGMTDNPDAKEPQPRQYAPSQKW